MAAPPGLAEAAWEDVLAEERFPFNPEQRDSEQRAREYEAARHAYRGCRSNVVAACDDAVDNIACHATENEARGCDAMRQRAGLAHAEIRMFYRNRELREETTMVGAR